MAYIEPQILAELNALSSNPELIGLVTYKTKLAVRNATMEENPAEGSVLTVASASVKVPSHIARAIAKYTR